MTTKFYDWQKTLSYNAPITMVVGARGIGKTFGIRLQCIRDYIKNKWRFCEISRFRTESDSTRQGYFDRLQSFFPECQFRTDSRQGYISLGTNSKGKPVWEPICYFVALTELQRTKKRTFNNVRRIIFDEALIDKNDQYHRYLPNEWSLLAGLVDSVSRERGDIEGGIEPRLYLLGNAVDIVNPIFGHFHINQPPAPGYTWHGHKLLLVHMLSDTEYGNIKATRTLAGRMLDGTAEGAAANYSEWSNVNSALIINRRPVRSKPFVNLLWHDTTFGVWTTPEARLYITHKPCRGVKEYGLAMENIEGTMLLTNKSPVIRAIVNMITSDDARFDSERTYYEFMDALRLTRLM